jgi:hypothetical protein
MSGAPPPPPPPPPPRAPPVASSLGPGERRDVLLKNSFSAKEQEAGRPAEEKDPAILKLHDELQGLREELKKLEKSPTSKSASESLIKFMAHEAEQGREPLTRPIETNSRWSNSTETCCVIA